jgi:hypothetical protein
MSMQEKSRPAGNWDGSNLNRFDNRFHNKTAWHMQFLKAHKQFNTAARSMTGNVSADREFLEGYRLVSTWESLADEVLCEFLVKHLRSIYRLGYAFLTYETSEHELDRAAFEFWQRRDQSQIDKAMSHAE